MNLRITLGMAGALMATSTGGYYLFRSDGDNGEAVPGPSIIPADDTKEVMLTLPQDDQGAHMVAITKYGGHFRRKIGDFIADSGLEMPDANSDPGIYKSWLNKGNELKNRIKDEFGLVVDDVFVDHGNIQ